MTQPRLTLPLQSFRDEVTDARHCSVLRVLHSGPKVGMMVADAVNLVYFEAPEGQPTVRQMLLDMLGATMPTAEWLKTAPDLEALSTIKLLTMAHQRVTGRLSEGSHESVTEGDCDPSRYFRVDDDGRLAPCAMYTADDCGGGT